jgi:hypothetical protein
MVFSGSSADSSFNASVRGNRLGQRFDLIELAAGEDLAPVLGVGAAQGKFLIQPKIPVLVEKAVERRAIIFVKLRVDTGFKRIEAEQSSGEAVNRADVASLHVSQRVVNAAVHLILGQLIEIDECLDVFLGSFLGVTFELAVEVHIQESLQALAQPELHLIGGFVGKGECDDLGNF